jgi:very-short-patch-repair endonuclease
LAQRQSLSLDDDGQVHPTEALKRHGGVAARRDLLGLTTRAELEIAARAAEVVADARGRYALPDTDQGLRTAGALSGALSHTSAALYWGWPVKIVPDVPHVTVRRKRHLTAAQQAEVSAHWRNLMPDELHGAVTTHERTLRDCLTDLPFDEALAVADSALREGAISRERLRALGEVITGPGARQARRVCACADGRAANPFESVLRAFALEVRGLSVTPQVTIRTPRLTATPDLVDVDRRVVLEADSHTWHSSRAALRRDCRRYNALVLDRWTVLRFTWEDVMFEGEDVRSCLEDLVRLADRQARRTRSRRTAA